MNIAEIESGLKELAEKPFSSNSFPYEFLALYDVPKATITKLKQGSSNEADLDGDILWKKKFFYRVAKKGQSAIEAEKMLLDPLTKKHSPRFIFVTDGVDFFARDLKTEVTSDEKLKLLNNSFDFFLPLAGVERYEDVAENPADIKATARLAKLYDAILESNPDWTSATHTHELNIFMTRMLFCFFAEDTSIFEPALFTSTLLTLTKEDGSDTASTIETIFDAMNLPESKRGALPAFAKRFPYVNGGLFASKAHVPSFSPKARRLLKECGSLVWREINPDIFGSMIQAVVEPEMRGDMGMHYTSVPNIMKVLHPLFLISLEEGFEAAKDSESKLRKLLERIYKIRVFDPACGSGNFLIIAYKELRKLESRIFERIKEISKEPGLQMTGIRLSQFFGIEYTDFATETAKLSLWIAEYQMNEVFKAAFGSAPPSLPLRESGQIVHENACQVEWLDVCPQKDGSETFIVGNPPYLGSVQQTEQQKEDMKYVFASVSTKYKDLDYVASWFLKAANYIEKTSAQAAFVSTNSISQGEQVAMLWPLILEKSVEIGFAHLSFKWSNSAAANAAVICVVVGLRHKSNAQKLIFEDGLSKKVKNINPYLVAADDVIVEKRSKQLCGLPKMDRGNMPTDGGNFILSTSEKDGLLDKYPKASVLIKRFTGSREFIQGLERWCLWINNDNLNLALSVPPIKERIENIRKLRTESKGKQANDHADTPHRFVFAPHQETINLLIPRHFSERREYLTIGFSNGSDEVIADSANLILNAPAYVFGILSSKLHAAWTAAVGGRLKSDYRYSNTLVYNTFPIPELSPVQQLTLEQYAVAILQARENHSGQTIAWMYNPETMPADLLKAHKDLDFYIESIYQGKPFTSDEERLEHLFKLYLRIIKQGQIQHIVQQVSLFDLGEEE